MKGDGDLGFDSHLRERFIIRLAQMRNPGQLEWIMFCGGT